MPSTQRDSLEKNLTLSPLTVELLNEAAVLPAVIDDSVGIISSSELQIDPSSQPLGSGTFATCFPALKRATLKCAVKVYKYMDYDQFDRELVAMLRCNRHKNAGVVELWWICIPPSGTTGLPRLVMPLVEGVTLGEWVSRYSRRSKPTTLRVVLQLVEAVQHLHDTVNIVHGDLGWKNVVINVARNYHLTLIDFGNARDAAKGKRRLWVHGNCYFSPPEALCRRPCDQTTAELHVLGVLLICIARGRTQGLCEAPLTFEDGRDRGEKSAISCLVQFWGRGRLYPYWNDFLGITGDVLETISGMAGATVSDDIGVVGLHLAHPIPDSRQSLTDALRNLTNLNTIGQ